MTKTRKRALASNLLFVSVIAAGVAWFLARTDQERLAEQVSAPYMTLRILPDSLIQRPVTGGTDWDLFYSIEALKQRSCAEILVEKFVHQLGEIGPLASNRDLIGETVSPSPNPVIRVGLHVRLGGKLPPGEYFMLLRSTCYVTADGVKTALSPPAEAFLCFRVTTPSNPGEEFPRLTPVSENCSRQLSAVSVRSPSLLALAR
jgi:hypothetical protein